MTEKRIAASRGNALESTGPKTNEGREESARKTLKPLLCTETKKFLREFAGGWGYQVRHS